MAVEILTGGGHVFPCRSPMRTGERLRRGRSHRRTSSDSVMMSRMSYRPIQKTRCLVEPPPAVMVAPDVFRLAVQELEVVAEPGRLDQGEGCLQPPPGSEGQRAPAGVSTGAPSTGSGPRVATSGTGRHDKSNTPHWPEVQADLQRREARRGQTERLEVLLLRSRIVTSATMAVLERRLPAALPMAGKVTRPSGVIRCSA